MEKKKYTFTGVLIAILKSIGYIFIWLLVSSLVLTFVDVLLALKYQSSTYEAIAKISASYGAHTIIISDILTILIFCLIYKIKKVGISERCQIKTRSFGAYIKVILLGIMGQFAVQYLLAVLIPVMPQGWIDALQANNDSIISASETMNIIATVIVAPVLEEIMCRGLVQGALRKAMPDWVSVLLSALIFGLLHTAWNDISQINFIGIIYAFSFGLLLGFVAVKFDSILPAILCHMAFNATSLALVGELSGFALILLNLSVPILVVLIIRTAKHIEPKKEEYDDYDEDEE